MLFKCFLPIHLLCFKIVWKHIQLAPNVVDVLDYVWNIVESTATLKCKAQIAAHHTKQTKLRQSMGSEKQIRMKKEFPIYTPEIDVKLTIFIKQ